MADYSNSILVVEDDEAFRCYLEELLSRNNCSVETAADGADGLEKAESIVPDLIITDLKMHGMDGFEFCDNIISSEFLSHIPIIIITGVDSEKTRLKGFEHGAVDFITKPIESDHLVMKVKNMITVRKKFTRKNWAYLLEKTFNDTELTEDEALLKAVYEVVTDKIGRYGFSVIDLASELNMSERTLYRKVKDLTGVPVAELIREIRLQRAQSLQNNGLVKTIQELANRVGYKSTKHFSRAYKKRFGVQPKV